MEKKKEVNLLKILLWVVIAVAVVIGIVFLMKSSIARQQEIIHQQELAAQAEAEKVAAEAAFKAEMQRLVENRVDPASITGNKAVAMVYEDSLRNEAVFTGDYVPESYRTEDASQVRYIIRIVKDKNMVGTYSNGGGFAWRYHFFLTLIDLKEEAVLHFEEMFGGEPPAVVTSDEGFSHTGSEPELERILGWAEEKIRLGVTEESERLWITVHAKLPSFWSAPHCKATDDDWGVFGENGTKNGIEYKKMDKDGEWYVVDVPNWVESLWFCSDPELSEVQMSEEDKIYGDDDVWLIVSETDGSVRTDYDAARANN